MSDQPESGLPAPAAPAGPVSGANDAMAEIKAMKEDPNHHLHKNWKENGLSDPEVEQLYKQAHGTREVDGSNAPADQSDQTTQRNIFLGDPSPEKESALEDLKTHWGEKFEMNVAAAQAATGYLIEIAPELVSRVMDLGLGNNREVLNALAAIGAKLGEGSKK